VIVEEKIYKEEESAVDEWGDQTGNIKLEEQPMRVVNLTEQQSKFSH